MKNQYFGDINDYLKYDLCIFLAENLPGINRFSFIPMLTADDASRDGGHTKYSQLVGRETLYHFLQDCLEDGQREVIRLRDYFKQQEFSFTYSPHWDTLDQEFTHEERRRYFAEVPVSTLQSAVILVDPDNGLEVKSAGPRNFHKYIKDSEVNELYQRMGSRSALILYQHLHRVQRDQQMADFHQRLQKHVQCPEPISIVSSRIALILLTKTPTRRLQLKQAIDVYLRRDLMLFS